MDGAGPEEPVDEARRVGHEGQGHEREPEDGEDATRDRARSPLVTCRGREECSHTRTHTHSHTLTLTHTHTHTHTHTLTHSHTHTHTHSHTRM